MILDKWDVFQDVHDLGEQLKIYQGKVRQNDYSHLMSPWRRIDRLTYLQKLFSDTPYYGRDLRQFNAAPWWYRTFFSLEPVPGARYRLHFEAVDYYCTVWVNGVECGRHEGYQEGFALDVTHALQSGSNLVCVKVWSPWDTEIEPGGADKRFFSVKRGMVKGTYEHADGFIQRDVNPVGIVGTVTLESRRENWLEHVRVKAEGDRVCAQVTLGVQGREDILEMQVRDRDGRLCARLEQRADAAGLACVIDHPKLWTTWDRGEAFLYTVSLRLRSADGTVLDTRRTRVGFSRLRLERTPDRTEAFLNGERIFLRGTSYFPDVYVCDLPPERLRRDLLLVRQAGFNAVRVHVHVEKDAFYDLCDELGLLVFQDTDFSWNHPTSPDWIRRGIALFEKVVQRLQSHPCLGCWILLNEPDKWKTSVVTNAGCSLSEIIARPDSISRAIGERLVQAVKRLDPGRAYIRASYNEDDPESGDSHNYLGSLRGQDTHYTQIAGTTEKLNTEFGMDAPGCPQALSTEKAVFDALRPVAARWEEIQFYQYKLLKYYIEHYRRQKHRPCGGYFQFMFIDLCPQSFYGVLDYWCIPKPGWRALEESNQPLAVMAAPPLPDSGKCALVIANDTKMPYSGIVRWSFLENGEPVCCGEQTAAVEADGLTVLQDVITPPVCTRQTRLCLTFSSEEGTLLAQNSYAGPFVELPHIPGHPAEIDSELGVRLFRQVADPMG